MSSNYGGKPHGMCLAYRYITVSSCVAKEELHPAAAQHHGGVGRVLVHISSLREALNSESQVWFLPSALLH